MEILLSIIGWLVLVGFNCWFTVLCWLMLRHGGLDLGPLEITKYWFAIPVLLLCICFWYLLYTIVPFTIMPR